MRALYIAATGMNSQQMNIDNISNNLANVSTTGFKRGRVDFQDLLYQSAKPAGANASVNTEIPTGINLGNGSRVASISKMFSQGSFQNTKETYDMLVEGEGFFQITMPNGETAYTRDGSFKLNSSGQVVTSNGDLLTPNITIPTNALEVTIATDGTVSAVMPGQTAPSVVGNIQIARFSNPAGLNAIGQNLFKETQSSGTAQVGTPSADGFGSLRQGFLEMSNVSMVEELVNMIVSQRAYEINSKAITTADEMLQTATQLKR
jgi:flagellar basal-body rod protein FlgG